MSKLGYLIAAVAVGAIGLLTAAYLKDRNIDFGTEENDEAESQSEPRDDGASQKSEIGDDVSPQQA